MQRMSDELLKWLFGVNEVLKMSIATEHSDAPAQAFQQYVLKCMCWFVRLQFHAHSFETITKIQKSGFLPSPSSSNLYFPLFPSEHFAPSCYRFFSLPLSLHLFSVSFFLPLFPCSLPTGSSEFPLVTAHPVISHCDSTLSSLPCFKEPLPLGGE